MAEPARVTFAPAPATRAAPPRTRPAAVVVTRPAAGTGPAARRPARPRPARRGAGSSFLTRLARLLRLGRIHLGRLNAEDLRVLAYLATAVVIAAGAQIDLDAPPTVSAPDTLPAAAAPAASGDTPAAAPAAAPAAGGMVDDPTSTGRITAATAHGLAEIRREFGPVLTGASCWDEHAWNPSSDHPHGRACDIRTSPARQFASGDGLVHGNRLVAWLREHAGPLQVSYVIWQGRIWSTERGDRAYNGGGVYDARDAVGGHFDHIHVSFRT